MANMVDSKQQKLNTFEIVHTALVDAGDTTTPMPAQLAGIITELSQPNAKVKQFGNTIFVAHMAPDNKAFVRAFNADTAANFVANMKMFCVYAYDELGLDVIVIPGMEDPNLVRLLKAVMQDPPYQGMGYQLSPRTDGKVLAVATIGPSRS